MQILTAKTNDGTIIILSSEMTREQLREWRKSRTFYCPQCKDLLHLKVGDIVIPHFAHKKDASCSASFSEGESKEHLLGKQQLFDFFQRIGTKVKLEPYFTELAQRPDLLVSRESNQVPIEFQCSTIPINQIESRTDGYKRAGMHPYWLLATPSKLKTLPQGVGIFPISQFEKSFFTTTFPEGLVFLTYDPQLERFHYYSSLIHVAGNQYIGIHRTLPISKQVFPFARPKIPTTKELQRYGWLYLSMRKKFLESRVFVNRKGINNPFLRKCYELGFLPVELPLWIGVPVTFTNSFRDHTCEWQLELLFFMNERRIVVRDLREVAIRSFTKKFEGLTELQVKACLNYRDFLVDAGIASFYDGKEFDEEDFVKQLTTTLLAK